MPFLFESLYHGSFYLIFFLSCQLQDREHCVLEAAHRHGSDCKGTDPASLDQHDRSDTDYKREGRFLKCDHVNESQEVVFSTGGAVKGLEAILIPQTIIECSPPFRLSLFDLL